VTVTSVHKDLDARTMTITADFDASVDRVWQMWADPRRLERWWPPPTHRILVDEHDLRAGGVVSYVVTNPDGGEGRATWRVRAVDAPHRLEFDLVDPNIPTVAFRVGIERDGGHTRMTVEASFASTDAMDRLLTIGFDVGLSNAIAQIDDVLDADDDTA
jgi:uncharacterized protein YndB with AHSA1/START domain